ncbi:MAG: hypothetical protein JWM11_1383 [Planctomycetaceae bacterium]|nr:hypothetical protein [Planctomycetaceae bacterium]
MRLAEPPCAACDEWDLFIPLVPFNRRPSRSGNPLKTVDLSKSGRVFNLGLENQYLT